MNRRLLSLELLRLPAEITVWWGLTRILGIGIKNLGGIREEQELRSQSEDLSPLVFQLSLIYNCEFRTFKSLNQQLLSIDFPAVSEGRFSSILLGKSLGTCPGPFLGPHLESRSSKLTLNTIPITAQTFTVDPSLTRADIKRNYWMSTANE